MSGEIPAARARILDNPFYVLGLRPTCTRAELEQEGQKLLGMLELAFKSALTYATPLGPMPRTAEKVRAAMAELRDPDRRLLHELWAQLEPSGPTRAPTAPALDTRWPDALRALRWRRGRP